MLIPYSTDAPLYHRPIATITAIVINVLMFLATGMGSYQSHRWLMLEFDRINPLQWVTATFMHASISHLVGNMIFLWCFGLVVEGKIGWRKFAFLYIGLALVGGAISQIPMFLMSGHGAALGASGVIFALMAIAMIWAPENEMSCIFLLTIFWGSTIDLTILSLGGVYLALNFIQAWWGQFAISSAVLHLLGAATGIPFAVYMLKHNLVDCEGYDLLNHQNGPPRRIHANRMRWMDPSFWTGYFFRPTPARDETVFQTKTHWANSKHNAVDQILADPSAYNPPEKSSDLSPDLTTINRSVNHLSEVNLSSENAPLEISAVSPELFSIPVARRSHQQSFGPSNHQSCDTTLMLLGQAIRNGNVNVAVSCFEQFDTPELRCRIPNKWIAHYANMLGSNGHHQESIRPLEMLVDRKSPYANQACLRLALIYWRYDQNKHAAKQILGRIAEPICSTVRRKRRRLLDQIRRQQTVMETATQSPASING